MTSAREIIRKKGIGASEVAAICGISPFGNAHQILARKKGFADPEPETEEMRWGTLLGPIIAGVFAHRANVPVEWYDQPVFSKKREWMFASPDAFILSKTGAENGDEPILEGIVAEARRVGVLECKTAGLHHAGEWDRYSNGPDAIPEYYLTQVQWQMSTLELPVAYVAVLIAGQDYRAYRIEHDSILEEILLEQVEPFYYQCVLGDQEPPIDPSKHTREYIRQRYPRHTEKLRPATETEAKWLNEYATVRTTMNALEDKRNQLENQLTHAIADAEGIESARIKMTWKRTKDRAKTNWQALAEQQLVGYSEEERNDLIQQHTEMIHGYRRIDFHDNEEQYAGQTHRNR